MDVCDCAAVHGNGGGRLHESRDRNSIILEEKDGNTPGPIQNELANAALDADFAKESGVYTPVEQPVAPAAKGSASRPAPGRAGQPRPGRMREFLQIHLDATRRLRKPLVERAVEDRVVEQRGEQRRGHVKASAPNSSFERMREPSRSRWRSIYSFTPARKSINASVTASRKMTVEPGENNVFSYVRWAEREAERSCQISRARRTRNISAAAARTYRRRTTMSSSPSHRSPAG